MTGATNVSQLNFRLCMAPQNCHHSASPGTHLPNFFLPLGCVCIQPYAPVSQRNPGAQRSHFLLHTAKTWAKSIQILWKPELSQTSYRHVLVSLYKINCFKQQNIHCSPNHRARFFELEKSLIIN